MRALPTALVALACVGCSDSSVPVTPRSFDHPGHVAFVCFDTATGDPVPLARCETEPNNTDLSLHALVTQTTRGEVAALDLRTGRLIDSDTRLPGFTFLPTGELPSAIVVPEAQPAYTYVAGRGSLDVTSVPTQRFRGESATAVADGTTVILPSGPTDLVVTPDGRFLYAALPDSGALAEIALDAAGAMGAVRLLPLSTAIPVGVPAVPGPHYCKACRPTVGAVCGVLPGAYPTDDAGVPQPLPPRTSMSVGPTAHPVALAVDAETNKLLVADANLGIVHVLALADAMVPLAVEEAPLAVGVPTSDVAITPAVPTGGGATTTSRYVYAIDATAGTVLVVDYDTGAVLAVNTNPNADSDRLMLEGSAQAITVATPDYPAGEVCDLATSTADAATSASSRRLRGVFLIAAMTDGRIQVVDVYDLDAGCRGGDAVCASPPVETDAEVYIRRHRPRLQVVRTDSATLGVAPSLRVDGVNHFVEADGSTLATDVPDLLPLGLGCSEAQWQAFPAPEDGGPVVCTLSDPFAARAEQWVASYGGVLPGSVGGQGRLRGAAAGGPALEVNGGLCGAGVLGQANLTGLGSEPEAGLPGDLLIITSALPPSTEDDAECIRQFVNGLNDSTVIALRILRSTDTSLELAAETTGRGLLVEPPASSEAPFSEVARCFPELVTHEVRVGGAYTVLGGGSAYEHRVTIDPASADGACMVDTTINARAVGRAVEDVPFDNGRVRFEIGASTPPFLEGRDAVTISFVTAPGPARVALDLGASAIAFPSSVRYSRADGRLYAVDISAPGLVQVSLESFAIVRWFQ